MTPFRRFRGGLRTPIDFSRSRTRCAREERIGNAPLIPERCRMEEAQNRHSLRHRVARHRVEIGGLILSKGNSAHFLDCAQPERPV